MQRIFNNSVMSTDNAIELLRSEIGSYVPYAHISRGAMRGDDSIYMAIALVPENEWVYGYIENTQYFRMAFYESGEMEVFTQSLYKKFHGKSYESRIKTKFRKCTAKSVEDAIKRIKTFIDKVNVDINDVPSTTQIN